MLIERVLLEFDPRKSFTASGKHIRDGLSSALRTGNNLWTCCDERASLERLTLLDDGSLGNHKQFNLHEYLRLPEGPDCEIDIEGLGIDQDKYLWLVGSHSLARKKPRKHDSIEKQIKRLSKVKEDLNRYVLARIPLTLNSETGYFELVNENHEGARPSQLKPEKGKNQLMDVLEDDPHFKPFLKIPGKDNGFDIEGLAVSRGKVFIGVRGPVLRGWAIILEVELTDENDGYFELKQLNNGRFYKKHFLHLEGMGIRDLRIQRNDMLILAGPTMDLDGTISVYRWKNVFNFSDDSIHHRKDLDRLFDVPHGYGENSGKDKAEGMALYDENSVLIVFDSPTDSRKVGASKVQADLFRI